VTAITLHAPLAGWAAPLEEVPDPVFAERMMGDGLAVDPLEGVLRAPCDAEVVTVPDTAHAVTLRLANGAEILIHIGLETVGLGGEGFTARVAAGKKVRQGDVLIAFDLDAVARKAKSLISPIVVTNEGFKLTNVATGCLVAVGDAIAEVAGRAGDGAAAENAAAAQSRTVAIGSTHGLHARPAARVAALAKGFGAGLELAAGGKAANVRSPVALMALGLKQGDRAELTARGADAAAALAAVAALLESQLDAPMEAAPASAAPVVSRPDDGRLHGVCAAPGFAMGPVARWTAEEIHVEERGRGIAEEREALDAARAAVAVRIAMGGSASGGIAAAHVALLEDPELLAAAEAGINAGRSAGFAWRAAVETSVAALRATGNALLIERIDDLCDVEAQVLAELAGGSAAAPRDFPEGVILIADNLLVSQIMSLDLPRLSGIATARGGPTSHVAILAASAGVPMLVAAGEGVGEIAEGVTILLDASAGWLDPAPDAETRAAAADRVERERRRRAAEAASAGEPCRMADGTRIEIFANLASAAETRRAVAAGAEGCGLLRTEFLFHDRPAPPTEEEQRAAYAEVAAALEGRPLIVRTLDAGGDKPLAYLSLPAEENPALGLRGVRLALVRPELLETQLRAILRAAAAGDLRIMVPMIVDVGELRSVRAALDAAAADLGVDPVPLGVMVETPAAALLAASLAAEADFLSIGTNDLSQYALAADRGNPATAPRLDALHPAVLRLIAAVGEGARGHGKWFGICGGVASDPLAAAILIGLGATELSAAPAAIPALKATVRRLSLDACKSLARKVLEAESAEAVRAMAAQALEQE
jgi:phosphocarrier protein FPr/phosphocarrier protein